MSRFIQSIWAGWAREKCCTQMLRKKCSTQMLRKKCSAQTLRGKWFAQMLQKKCSPHQSCYRLPPLVYSGTGGGCGFGATTTMLVYRCAGCSRPVMKSVVSRPVAGCLLFIVGLPTRCRKLNFHRWFSRPVAGISIFVDGSPDPLPETQFSSMVFPTRAGNSIFIDGFPDPSPEAKFSSMVLPTRCRKLNFHRWLS